jgi:hypothetical protein
MKTDLRAELRLLPSWLAAAVVLLAILVLAVRIVGLLVIVAVDISERVELAVATRLDIAPIGVSSVILPPDWAPRDGA